MIAHRPYRVLIVDDSALIRRVLAEGIERSPDLEVAGFASNGDQATELLATLTPDVITLDLEMPGMDGLTFLRSYLRKRPIPTVVISSATNGNNNMAIQAVEAGAVDIISKPRLNANAGLAVMMSDVCARIVAAAKSRPRLGHARTEFSRSIAPLAPSAAMNWVFAIGASTGGIQALSQELPKFPAGSPPIVLVQHMPEGFTRSFANRMDMICPMDVVEAQDGDQIRPGCIYVAPGGDRHMIVERQAGTLRARLINGDPVCYSRPSVDVLFQSVAQHCGRRTVASLLTGMGRDGADGMMAIRRSGGATFAQNKEPCVVFGMPSVAQKIGAAQHMVPLDEVAQRRMQAVGTRQRIPGDQT